MFAELCKATFDFVVRKNQYFMLCVDFCTLRSTFVELYNAYLSLGTSM